MLLADGRTNEQIAAELFMSPKTASVHVSRIISKLGVANRTEAAAYAHRNGLAASPGQQGGDPTSRTGNGPEETSLGTVHVPTGTREVVASE